MTLHRNHKTLFGLDYELFFGTKTGSVDNCLIEPTNALASILEKHGAKLTLFVDAGYLVKLLKLSTKYAQLSRDYQKIQNQLSELCSRGHNIQLHTHPHWEDCDFNGNEWKIDTSRYRLQDYPSSEIDRILPAYIEELSKHTSNPIFAFRAGGWCLQPFNMIQKSLNANGIWLDSTAYLRGHSNDPKRWFNFEGMPSTGSWQFSEDPLAPNPDGEFLEIPISSTPLSPLFYWKMAFAKQFAKSALKPFGDGYSMQANSGYYLKRLTQTTFSPVSIDGIKASALSQCYRYHRKFHSDGIFNVMGHPKSLSRYSLNHLDRFLSQENLLTHISFGDLEHLKPTSH